MRMRLQVRASESFGLRESDSSFLETLCTPAHNSRNHGELSRVCVGPLSCLAAGVSASSSAFSVRSRCRALPAAVVPCMSLDVSPMHDAKDSRCTGGLLLVCKSTSYNLEVGSQDPTRRKGTKGGVSSPAEDLSLVSEVEAGVNFAAGRRVGKLQVHLPVVNQAQVPGGSGPPGGS